MLAVPNGSTNVVPGRCQFTLDIRATTDPVRDACAAEVLAELEAICTRRGLSWKIEETMRAAAAPCAPGLAAALGAGGRGRRTAGVPHAQRRRPRRDEAARGDAAGDAVRARRERRHQPQPARVEHQRRHPARGRNLRPPARDRSPPTPHSRAPRHDRSRTPRRLDRRPLRRRGALPASAGAGAHRHPARQQRAACRAHGRTAAASSASSPRSTRCPPTRSAATVSRASPT